MSTDEYVSVCSERSRGRAGGIVSALMARTRASVWWESVCVCACRRRWQWRRICRSPRRYNVTVSIAIYLKRYYRHVYHLSTVFIYVCVCVCMYVHMYVHTYIRRIIDIWGTSRNMTDVSVTYVIDISSIAVRKRYDIALMFWHHFRIRAIRLMYRHLPQQMLAYPSLSYGQHLCRWIFWACPPGGEAKS